MTMCRPLWLSNRPHCEVLKNSRSSGLIDPGFFLNRTFQASSRGLRLGLFSCHEPSLAVGPRLRRRHRKRRKSLNFEYPRRVQVGRIQKEGEVEIRHDIGSSVAFTCADHSPTASYRVRRFMNVTARIRHWIPGPDAGDPRPIRPGSGECMRGHSASGVRFGQSRRGNFVAKRKRRACPDDR